MVVLVSNLFSNYFNYWPQAWFEIEKKTTNLKKEQFRTRIFLFVLAGCYGVPLIAYLIAILPGFCFRYGPPFVFYSSWFALFYFISGIICTFICLKFLIHIKFAQLKHIQENSKQRILRVKKKKQLFLLISTK